MHTEKETLFVKQFIIKDRRDRLLHELTHPKKRQNALSRFCHSTEDMIDARTVFQCGTDVSRETIIKFLCENNSGNTCYVMAYLPELDGVECSIEEAVNKVIGNGMAAIILADCAAFIETEQAQGAAIKYLLKSNAEGI